MGLFPSAGSTPPSGNLRLEPVGPESLSFPPVPSSPKARTGEHPLEASKYPHAAHATRRRDDRTISQALRARFIPAPVFICGVLRDLLPFMAVPATRQGSSTACVSPFVPACKGRQVGREGEPEKPSSSVSRLWRVPPTASGNGRGSARQSRALRMRGSDYTSETQPTTVWPRAKPQDSGLATSRRTFDRGQTRRARALRSLRARVGLRTALTAPGAFLETAKCCPRRRRSGRLPPNDCAGCRAG